MKELFYNSLYLAGIAFALAITVGLIKTTIKRLGE